MKKSLKNIKIKKYPDGGTTPKKQPIVVTDPNNPRLRAYNDSLGLYNMTLKNRLQVPKGSSSTNDPFLKKANGDEWNAMLLRQKLSEDGKKNNDKNIKLRKSLGYDKSEPEYSSRIGLNTFYVYKKPVQPVVYQAKTKPTTNPIMLSKGFDRDNSTPALYEDYKAIPEPVVKQNVQTYSAAGYPMIGGKKVLKGYVNGPGNKANKSNNEYPGGGVIKPDYTAIIGGITPMLMGMINNQSAQAGAAPKNSTAMGAVSGAMSGASAGSSLGPWGIAGGAVLGGVAGGITANKQYKNAVADFNQTNSNNLFNDREMEYTNRINKDLAGLNFAQGGYIPNQDNPQWIFNTWANKMAQGGLVPAELESEENVLLPNGTTKQFDGASHEAGGIKTMLPENTMVFSDRLKLGGKTFADLAKKHSTTKYEKILKAKDSTPLAKKTATKMIDISKKSLTSLFNTQEAMKEQEFTNEFQKKLGGIIKKYYGGGLTPQEQLKSAYDKGVSKQKLFNNQPAALWDVPVQYDNTPLNTPASVPYKPINFVTGEGLPKASVSNNKLPSEIGTPNPQPNWWDRNKGALGTLGLEATKGIANNIGNLSYLLNEGKSYDKVTPRTITPEYINADAQINEAKQAGATGNYLLRNTFAGSPGSLLSGLPQSALQTGRAVSGIRSEVNNANAGIANQTKQYNSQVTANADAAQQANKDAAYTAYYQYLSKLGENTNKGIADKSIKDQAYTRDLYLENELLKLNKWMSKYYNQNN